MNFKRLPGVVAMRRTLVVTDAVMSNLFDNGETSPVSVIRHGIRGTQNVNNDKDRSVSNVQETETAKLSVDAIGMRVAFNLRFLDLATGLSVCTPGKDQDVQLVADFKDSLNLFINRTKRSNGLNEVALRYARNIANGRWLWRNYTIADRITIRVKLNDKIIDFDATAIPHNHFGDYSENEKILGKHIASCLAGEADGKGRISVRADLEFDAPGAAEVYPSQNYIENKPKGFARSLYKYNTSAYIDTTNNNIVGCAAIRDQKIGNALRTFDTWYADYSEHGQPIPIEPNGASLDAQVFFRKNGKDSAFNLFLKFNQMDPDTAEGMFCIGSLIRGGVYSGEKEEPKAKKGKAAEAAAAEVAMEH